MNFCDNYITRLFQFSNETEGIEMKFKDNNIEEKYIASNCENENKKTYIFCLFCFISYLISIIGLFVLNQFRLEVNMYVLISGLIFDLVIFKLIFYWNKDLKLVSALKFIRFFYMYLTFAAVIILPLTETDLSNCSQARILWGFILYMNLLYLYYLHFNMVVLALVPLLNCILISIIQFSFNFPKFYFAFEFSGNILYYLHIFFIKKYDNSLKKQIFFESYKNDHFIDYITQLINSLNNIFVSVNNKEVLFMNNFSINYFKKKKNFKIREDIQEKEFLSSYYTCTDQNQHVTIHSYMNSYFKSLILDTPFDDETQKKSLSDIITNKLACKNFESRDFNRIGIFKSSNEPIFFEIYLRKLKFKEEVVELLFNDITEIKLAEKTNIEIKYKKMILAKIAHEFKTPLISIISLVQKIMSLESEFRSSSIRCSLNHINNLSNYSIVLISDIITYASNSVNLMINLNEIILREILDFSFNVLKTLVQCNQNKVNAIDTLIEIDESIDELTIVSDENRLKQIFLNLISNAVKFTKLGFIKIQVKYLRNLESIEVNIKDTGLGIKKEDYSKIFEENIQLNIEKQYNSEGSGLGLSITRNLADLLDHQIGFSSEIGEGSNFYLRMKCKNNKTKLTESKTEKFDDLTIKNNNNKLAKSKTGKVNDSTLIKNSTNSVMASKTLKDNTLSLSLREKKRKDSFSELEEKKLDSSYINLKNIRNNDKNSISTKSEKFNLFKTDEISILLLKSKLSDSNIIESKLSDRDILESSSFSFSIGQNYVIDDNTFKILVIDDNLLVRQNSVNLIKTVLSNLNLKNYLIIEGSDGIDLLNYVRYDFEYRIKHIFIDENMEYLNGSEAVRFIRKFEENKKIKNYKIISVTAFDDDETKSRILKSGLNKIISKPCTKSDLTRYFKDYSQN